MFRVDLLAAAKVRGAAIAMVTVDKQNVQGGETPRKCDWLLTIQCRTTSYKSVMFSVTNSPIHFPVGGLSPPL